jgi:hypothetical protein
MTAWTADIIGMAGEGRAAKAEGRSFREPVRRDLYDRYVVKAAQAQGLIAHVYIPKGTTVAASDTFTLTVKEP